MFNSLKYFKIIFLLAIISIVVFLHKTNLGFEHLTRSVERTIKLDRRKAPNEENFVVNITREIPYLPIEDLINPRYEKRSFNQSCAWYPSLTDIKIHNDYWQEFQNHQLIYFIFGAYLDNRPTVVKSEPVVRVLIMINFLGKEYKEYPISYCQLWYDEQLQPFLVPMKEMHKLWYYDWGNSPKYHYAHFVNCPLPKEHLDWIPKSVSLVAQACDKATNNVRVTYQPLFANEVKKEFAVCHKTLNYPGLDKSLRFVEYFETLRILGVEKITMYHYTIHPNTTKVLNYYKDTGFLEYRPMSLSMEVSNLENYRHLEMKNNAWSAVLHELIHYNDCFYRNMYRFKYIANIDNDELIMPLGNLTSWHDLAFLGDTLEHRNCAKIASFCFRCVYFPQYPEKSRYSIEIPEYFYMLQHVARVKKPLQPGYAVKCLHNTQFVIGTHNHFPMHWVPNACDSYTFEPNVAQMNHYREPEYKITLADSVIDLSLWRFKDEIIKSSTKVLEELEFFSKK